LIAPALLLVGGMLLLGCGSGSEPGPSDAARAEISQRDFKIKAPRTLPEGQVDLEVYNRGPDDHELIVVRGSGRLPRRSDGLTIDEDALDPETVGALEPGLGERDLALDLRPGRYEMFCNMQGHYMAGMHRSFRVG
jgi:uncharacterized cupredoxin-like copper-binding protein